MDRAEENRTSGIIVSAAMKVHTWLGPGVLESAYEQCLAHELGLRGRRVRRQVALPLVYEGLRLRVGYRLDLLVDDAVIVEVKAVTALLPIHEAQLVYYLRLSRCRVGLLINFHERRLKNGIRRMVV